MLQFINDVNSRRNKGNISLAAIDIAFVKYGLREMSVTGAHSRPLSRFNNTIFHVLLYARSDKFITSHKTLSDKQGTRIAKAV